MQLDVVVTPQAAAEAFAAFNDTQQAEFFQALYRSVKKWNSKWDKSEYGDMQWYYLEKKLKGKPRAMLMSLAAPCFLQTVDYVEKRQFWIELDAEAV